MRRFIICYYGSSGDGYVGYDNTPCRSLDYAMTFDDRKEAERCCAEFQKEWLSELRVEAV